MRHQTTEPGMPRRRISVTGDEEKEPHETNGAHYTWNCLYMCVLNIYSEKLMSTTEWHAMKYLR